MHQEPKLESTYIELYFLNKIIEIYFVLLKFTYIEGNVCMAAINKPTYEACVPSHRSVNRTLSKECAVNIV